MDDIDTIINKQLLGIFQKLKGKVDVQFMFSSILSPT